MNANNEGGSRDCKSAVLEHIMKAKTCCYILLLVCLGGSPHAVAQPTNAANWGEAAEGVQVRLRAKQTNWNRGDIPRLFVDVRNQGPRRLLVQKQLHSSELEVDGLWFRPANTRSTSALPSPFPPGREYDGIVVDLNDYWILRPQSGEANKLGRAMRVKDKLTPGKHVVRVAVTATADKTEPGKPVRALSNPVEIEILPGKAAEKRP